MKRRRKNTRSSIIRLVQVPNKNGEFLQCFQLITI